jgi:hypothetical protein
VALSIRQFPFLVDKALVTAQVEIDGPAFDVPIPAGSADALDTPASAASPGADRAPTAGAPDPELITVPLIRLAWGRSGDKGDTSNIGILARRPELLPVLRAQLTEAAVAAHLAHLVRGTVTRYELPGIGALNFVCSEALGGGGMASLRSDPLGKGMAQVLLAMPVQVGAALLALLRP